MRYNEGAMNRAGDWMEQAKADLQHARHSILSGDFEWACFAAQQAAEKALKAVHLRQGAIVWGHSVLDLLEALPTSLRVGADVQEAARRLDRHYLAPRYPDVYPAGPPRRYDTERDAREAVTDAERVVIWCDQNLAPQPGANSQTP